MQEPLPKLETTIDRPESGRSIFTRLVRGAIGLALVSLLVLFGVTMWESWNATQRSLSATVDTDIAGLVDIYASSGEEELLARLEDRSTLVSLEGRQARYMLVRPDGTILGGNIKQWPTLGAGLSEQGFLTLVDGTKVFARATRLSPDLDLLVARTYERDSTALLRLVAVFLGTAAVIVLAVWLIGRNAVAKLRQRIIAISSAFRAAEHGRDVDLPDSQFDDEVGELAYLSTRAIGRSAGLARTHRHMSDHIAHEIRTPLTHLDNRLVNAMRSLPEGVDPAMIEQGRQDIKSVVTMLDSLLDIAASESRVGDLVGLEDVDLSALASNLVELYDGSAEEAGISLRSFIEPKVHILGEPMQLTRLISNLLDNALKYVPRGGQVTLSIADGPVIEVRDDGPGIDEALRPLVFERFRTGHHVQGKNSHGLGLALARAIAMRHGMGIGLVASQKGAHFVIKPHAMWTSGEVKA
ncbi:two-component system sensor histidine kinase UczS [Alteraurantiacibacter aestuarii]|uniref:histidine kinase n=1 Tax=Alteraurantiacibacter aestuarii TaxID=650004 RepID=A0A844ZHL6_9SPHN|nr:HAMP domain-containing sensor histidine kinase [Alteraurantiacibacter aestuarii]MXO87325.1 sensor histidine kinase [Alteraurantiacibacter aestuarii]